LRIVGAPPPVDLIPATPHEGYFQSRRRTIDSRQASSRHLLICLNAAVLQHITQPSGGDASRFDNNQVVRPIGRDDLINIIFRCMSMPDDADRPGTAIGARPPA
jgi:hypothetical protein